MENYRIIPGAILIILGVSALLDMSLWQYVWPAFLIFLGIKILSPKSNNPLSNPGKFDEESGDKIDVEMIFSGNNKRISSEDFKGGKITTVFGGGEIDLREAKIKDGETAELEVNNIFGGGKIYVPETWNVNTSVTGVVGGYSNTTKIPKKGEEKGRLVIKGAAVFGGGEVTN